MKKITLSGFLNFFTAKDLVFNSGESGFKLDFTNQKSKESILLEKTSSSSINSIIVLLVTRWV